MSSGVGSWEWEFGVGVGSGSLEWEFGVGVGSGSLEWELGVGVRLEVGELRVGVEGGTYHIKNFTLTSHALVLTLCFRTLFAAVAICERQ